MTFEERPDDHARQGASATFPVVDGETILGIVSLRRIMGGGGRTESRRSA
jgi:hypothetical protein